jgi:hypothetical protein
MLIYWIRVHTIKKPEELILPSEETEVELHANKTKYMFMYRDQNAGWIHSIRTDNRFFENVEVFKYLGTNLTHKILFMKRLKAV